MFSDASDIAAGAFTVETNEKVFHKAWSKHECAQSYTDNQNCEKIVQRGSRKLHLQNLALSIFSKCVEKCISLNIVWIPRYSYSYLILLIDLPVFLIQS